MGYEKVKKVYQAKSWEMQTCGKFWEELHELGLKKVHVKAHRTKKDMEKMSKIERFVTEG